VARVAYTIWKNLEPAKTFQLAEASGWLILPIGFSHYLQYARYLNGNAHIAGTSYGACILTTGHQQDWA